MSHSQQVRLLVQVVGCIWLITYATMVWLSLS